MTPLDRIDMALIEALQKDARASNKELAARVGLSPSSTHGRVKRLVDAGVIRGAHADVDPEAVGIALQALVIIRLSQHSRATGDGLRAHLLAQPEVVAVWYVGGEDDFLAHVAVRDTRHLSDFLMDRVTARSEVGRVRTEIVFDHVRKPVLPTYVAGGRGSR